MDPACWKVDTLWATNKILKTKFTSAIPYEGLLYGLSDGVLECIDPKDGSRLWRGKRYGHGQAIIVNGNLLVTTEDGRIALVPATATSQGKPIAEMTVLEGITWNVPAVAGPYLLVRNAEFAACLLSNKGAREDAGSKPEVQ
jgi:outer membrane protein assembly factor BamB